MAPAFGALRAGAYTVWWGTDTFAEACAVQLYDEYQAAGWALSLSLGETELTGQNDQAGHIIVGPAGSGCQARRAGHLPEVRHNSLGRHRETVDEAQSSTRFRCVL